MKAQADKEKKFVATASVVAAVFLVVMKLVIGLSTRSIGILSEAAHSGLDLVAAGVTLVAIHAAARPPDSDHNYGHGKIENLAALFEAVLLLATCGWIITESVERLLFRQVHVDVTIWAFLTMAISIVIDWTRSRALFRVAERYQSQALEADALHFSTDIWSSAVVLLGLVLLKVSDVTGITWLANADAIAALGVAVIVIWVSVQLGRRTIAALLDEVPPALREEIVKAVQVPGVLEVRQVRLRRSGPELFVEAALTADRGTSFERAHRIALEAEAAVRAIHPEADLVVRIDPVPGGHEGLLDAIHRVAASGGHHVHGVRIHRIDDRPSVEMYLEVDESSSLEFANRWAMDFEKALRREFPFLGSVTTHLEPVGDDSAHMAEIHLEQDPVNEALEAICRSFGVTIQPSDLALRRVGHKLSVSFRCGVGDVTSMTAAHVISGEIERQLRDRVPQIDRVMIRVEPLTPSEVGARRSARAAAEEGPSSGFFPAILKNAVPAFLRPSQADEINKDQGTVVAGSPIRAFSPSEARPPAASPREDRPGS